MFKYTHIKSDREAHQMMTKYLSVIPERYYELLEEVVLGFRKEAFIPQSEIDKWEKELHEREAFYERLNLTAERNNLGMACENAGDLEGAIKQYELNVADRVEATHPYNRLMVIYRRQKKFEDELRVIDIAIDLYHRLNEKRCQNAASKPENRKYFSELQTAMEECRGVTNDKGKYIFSPYPVMKWILRREKTEALILKSNSDYVPISPTARVVKWQPVIPKNETYCPPANTGTWDAKKLLVAAALLIFISLAFWLVATS